MKFFSMQFFPALLPIALIWSLFAHAPHPKPAVHNPSDSVTLESVLKKMDAAAAAFRTTQAQFEWDRYEKVIDETDDIEYGTIYYRRTGKDIEMMAEVTKPDKKYVLFSEGKIKMYLPKADQVTVWDLGKSSSDFESYLVLGFGGSGQDLTKSFDVTLVNPQPQTVGDVATAELQLVPKSVKLRNNIAKILLWIDLERGISVQQQFFEPEGDYRLTKYSAIQVNGKKIPDDVFKLKTTSKTQTISPHG
jgi:outer membrane lipoprotein-sorting protein